MALKKIQEDVDHWTGQFEPQYWPPHEILARMVEEVGELAREINHAYGTKKKKDGEQESRMSSEIIDIIFTATCMANSHGIDLDEAWERMKREKLYTRDKERFSKRAH